MSHMCTNCVGFEHCEQSAQLPQTKTSPDCWAGGARVQTLAESWGFEPQIPLGGILA